MSAIVFIPSDDLEVPSQRINIDAQVRETIASRAADAGGCGYEHSDDEAYLVAENIANNYAEANPSKDVQLLWDHA